MAPVFAHGRLRLYLLKLLDESPRHGYEIIQQLRERFAGLYAPSAGTVYPRLARLESEGLVRHETEGGRKVYYITEAGRAELAAKAGELDALETEIRASLHDLAEGIREEVRESARTVRDELEAQARAARARTGEPGDPEPGPGRGARDEGRGAAGAGAGPRFEPGEPFDPDFAADFGPGLGAPPPESADWGRDEWREWRRAQQDQWRDWRREQKARAGDQWKDWQRAWKEQWTRQWKEQWEQQWEEQRRAWQQAGPPPWKSWLSGFLDAEGFPFNTPPGGERGDEREREREQRDREREQRDRERERRDQEREWEREQRDRAHRERERERAQRRDRRGGPGFEQLAGQLSGLVDFARRDGMRLFEAAREHGPLSDEQMADVRDIVGRAITELRDIFDAAAGHGAAGPKDAKPSSGAAGGSTGSAGPDDRDGDRIDITDADDGEKDEQ